MICNISVHYLFLIRLAGVSWALLTHRFQEKMSPSTQTPWSAFQRTLWWKANSAAPRTVHSGWEPQAESRLDLSWRTQGQCWGQRMSTKSRRRRRDWCPASPLAICPQGPWWENDKRRGHEGKKLRWGKYSVEMKVTYADRQLLSLFVWFKDVLKSEVRGRKRKRPSSGNIRQKIWP